MAQPVNDAPHRVPPPRSHLPNDAPAPGPDPERRRVTVVLRGATGQRPRPGREIEPDGRADTPR